MRHSEHIYVVTSPIGPARKRDILNHNGQVILNKREQNFHIVSGPYFTQTAADECAEVFKKKLKVSTSFVKKRPVTLVPSISREGEWVPISHEDADTTSSKKRVVYPQPPENWSD